MPSIPPSARLIALSLLVFAAAPRPGLAADTESAPSMEELAAGLQLRSLGPALMGGRIADVAVDPRDRSVWYVAVGSGGVWRSDNAGTTWTPLFDEQPSYSIGCVTLDPSNPDVVWVGAGENVSGRHVGWGDGVYKSLDRGKSWTRVGLEGSEHIGEIVVHPDDSDVVWVAAEGPLWSSGGERGLYKTTDGGTTWSRSLRIDADTGVTDVAIDPRNPDLLYAASYQRRRRIWSLLAGGPGSGLHKSTDGGVSWRRLESGLPEGDMGKIGLAISPADPDVVYATIEAAEEERGFYRSTDRGESWERRNEYISNGTGPHYYQEIEASPHDVGVVYQMDVFLHVTRDGGASFEVVGTGREKHSDNHALVIDPKDPEHLLAGTDASLYESFDGGDTWRQTPNLPISQLYKLALGPGAPFYDVLGGAQDLGTLLGPSGTTNLEGVRNRDWFVPLGADGYDCAFDREDPRLLYIQWQRGRLVRYDRASDEALDLQPIPAPGDPPERWNWDAPLLTSPHSPTRLYFGSQRLWRSDDRGDSWTPVSGDLTRNRNRYELEVLGRVQSVDALYDNGAMSWYGTLTAIAESPLVEGLLYTGSDDGLLQVSENGGASWKVAELPGVPELLFVNDVQASRHDPDTVFAALDAHKSGNLRPLVFESRDRGRSWRSLVGDLPEETVVWSLEQDPGDPELLFAGTEFGLFFTPDRGERWLRAGGGVPTIPFRDVEIQAETGDLVGATFGRGFYVLDDYAPLRHLEEAVASDATLLPIRDAWWFVPSEPMQAAGQPSLGSTAFKAPNPPFGALFTYALGETTLTAAERRRAEEEELEEREEDVPFPGWENLAAETLEEEPTVLLTIRDAGGRPIRHVPGPVEAGLHRVSWDLRLPPPDPVDLEPPGFRPPWVGPDIGPLAPPGRYSVQLSLRTAGGVEPLDEPREFTVRPLPGFSLGEPDFAAVTAFQADTSELLRRVSGMAEEIERAEARLRHIRAALLETPRAAPETFIRLDAFAASLTDLRRTLLGDAVRGRWNEPAVPSVRRQIGQVAGGHWKTRQEPTRTQRESLEIARSALAEAAGELRHLLEVELREIESALESAGAPWTPGRPIPSVEDG